MKPFDLLPSPFSSKKGGFEAESLSQFEGLLYRRNRKKLLEALRKGLDHDGSRPQNIDNHNRASMEAFLGRLHRKKLNIEMHEETLAYRIGQIKGAELYLPNRNILSRILVYK